MHTKEMFNTNTKYNCARQNCVLSGQRNVFKHDSGPRCLARHYVHMKVGTEKCARNELN